MAPATLRREYVRTRRNFVRLFSVVRKSTQQATLLQRRKQEIVNSYDRLRHTKRCRSFLYQERLRLSVIEGIRDMYMVYGLIKFQEMIRYKQKAEQLLSLYSDLSDTRSESLNSISRSSSSSSSRSGGSSVGSDDDVSNSSSDNSDDDISNVNDSVFISEVVSEQNHHEQQQQQQQHNDYV